MNGGEDEHIEDIVGKSEEKRQLGRPRRTWMDNIIMNFREKEWSGMDRVDLAKDMDQ
jgi:hypothetical protein